MPTLIVETGSGIVNANAYDSRANVIQYVKDHSNHEAFLGAGGGEKDQHIVLATQYLDTKYHLRWKGRASFSKDDQALDWPRVGITEASGYTVDSDEIPRRLKEAMAEMALRSFDAEAAGSSLQADESGPGSIQRKKVKAGPVEQDITYGGAGQATQPRYPLVDRLLSGYLSPRGRANRG